MHAPDQNAKNTLLSSTKRIWMYQNPNWYSSEQIEGTQEVQGRSGVEAVEEISLVYHYESLLEGKAGCKVS